MKKILALVLNESKSVLRDSLLVFIVVYPVVFALLARFAVPPLRDYLLRFNFDLQEYYAVIMVLIAILTPYMLGLVEGFVLLEEKEAQTLKAIAVTPLTLSSFFIYKMAVTISGSLLIVLIMVPLAGLTPVNFLQLVAVALLAALGAPFYALLLSVLANNKIEGFAVAKGTGFLLLLPVLGFFIPHPWDLLVGIAPGYWPAKAFGVGVSTQWGAYSFWFYLLVGIVYNVFLIAVFLNRFRKKI